MTTSHFDHAMIDIETMSLNKHNALVLSIGMIEFDPEPLQDGLQIGSRSLLVLNIPEQLMLGREITASTQKWWRDQPPEASLHWREPSVVNDVSSAVSLVRKFCAEKSRVWANGNQFDLANLEGLANAIGQPDLWHYQAPRDMRTFCRETAPTRLLPERCELGLIPHHPVDDSIRQAWQVWAHWAS